ncbi:MAG: hydantoinase B/oxoprolinase family protein [Chloroflexi bacterium]|nr:hydantoinase B/oxoprolinase family protein [Chloroflexota bacterium]MQC19043.1 hydantoinase B/oxoprolinase family protein [Chloroflexota bacterium]
MTLSASDLSIADAALTSVAEEMGEALGRTAFSPNIKERRDHSCGVFNASGEMVAQAAHIPVHLGAMPAAVRQVLALAPFQPGDVLALNDPFLGGTHLPDLTTVAPVFAGHPEPIAFVATRAHHADIGGMAPGSMPMATELLQEGLVIPPIRLVDAGRVNEAAMALIVRNSRAPDERRGDLRAQLAATELGARRIEALGERFGLDPLRERFSALLDHGERVIRTVISEIPDGVYEAEDWLEVGDGLSIRLRLEIAGERVHFDFTGTADETTEASLNAVAAVTRSACYFTIRCLAGRDAPANEGCYRPVQFTLPARSLVAAGPPRAVSAGNVETSQRIVDVALNALALALPERIPAASQGTMNNITIGGFDSRRGRPYAYYETIAGGAGGGPLRTGRSGVHTHMTNTMNTPVEALPLAYPFTVERYTLRPNTGGAGQHPGGDGLVREYRFEDHATVTLVTERRARAPRGRAGGHDGAPGRNLLVRANGETLDLGARAQVTVGPDDRIRVETPGGGGWGEAPRMPTAT